MSQNQFTAFPRAQPSQEHLRHGHQYNNLWTMSASLPPSPPYGESSHSPPDLAKPEATTPTPSESVSHKAATPSEPQQSHQCLWTECTLSYADPETLYNHLCNDHIGRKSTNNLCLTCKWKDCGTSCAKRDHITSHLRVHTPLKPHICEICKKSFKRPQDLKKHEKIHTEEHHAQHKHSKAITVVDPSYVQRVRGDPHIKIDKLSPGGDHMRGGAPRSKSHSSDGSHFGILPTPSPELAHMVHHPHHQSPALHDELLSHHQLPSWEILRPDASAPAVSAGTKRSHEYNVDDFFTDMKKRRVTPSYDSRMAERLNNLAYSQQNNMQGAGFNPRSVSFNITTPEELAAVNEFLVTLGRDVTGQRVPASQPQPPPQTNPFNTHSSNFFDAVNLSQLGLAGLPGFPTSDHPGFHNADSPRQHFAPSPTFSNPRTSVGANSFGSMYPQVDDLLFNNHDYQPQRRASNPGKYPSSQSPLYQHPTPPHDPHSPHSSVSTPLSSTPPQQVPLSSGGGTATIMPLAGPGSLNLNGPLLMNGVDFDFIRTARGPANIPTLSSSAHDFLTKQHRTMLPLKSVPPASPMEPKVVPPVLRGGVPKLVERSVYPVLSDDAPVRLPSLKEMYRSPSPDSRTPTPDAHILPSIHAGPSRSSQSPPMHTLPSMASSRSSSESPSLLERSIHSISLDDQDRSKHADLIKSLLVAINSDFRSKHGHALRAPSPMKGIEVAV